MTIVWGYLLAAGVGFVLAHLFDRHGGKELLLGAPDPALLFRVVLASDSPSPTPSGAEPAFGLASALAARWVYVVQKDDSAGSIAKRIVGDSARYQDLLLVNPEIPKAGKPGVYRGETAWNFAPGSLLASKTGLRIPETWAPWIDQMGFGRGSIEAWPPDLRDAPAASVTVQTTTSAGVDRQYGVPRGLLKG